MRLRKIALAVGGAVSLLIGLMATTPEASAANTSPSQTATVVSPYQEATAALALANNPSGVRIAANQVAWNNRTVIMTIPASPEAGVGGCPSGFFSGQWTCVYRWRNFQGTRLQFQDAGYYQNLYQYGGFDWHTWSYSNTRGQRAWLNENANHNHPGAQYCMSGNTAGSDIFGPWSNDQWIYLSSNTDRC
jgi:hypothetical protein